MGKFKTACPNCHTELEVCGEWSGCQAYCPTCNSLITIPFPSEEPEEGRMVVCPECGLTQKIPPDGAKHLYNCRSCGAPFAASSSLIFRIAKKLPPDEPGMLKIACPYCGWHYILGYNPKNGLVGCPKCLNIFVSPEAEWLNQEEATPATIPPPAAARPEPASPAEELLAPGMRRVAPPPPPPPRRSAVPTDTQHLTPPNAQNASQRNFILPSQASALQSPQPQEPPPAPPSLFAESAMSQNSIRNAIIVASIVIVLILAAAGAALWLWLLNK